jgi:acetyl-CoA C-acetyltransferase
MEKCYIIDGMRTPIGRYGGALKDFKATELGSLLVKQIMGKNKLGDSNFDGLIMGNVLQAGLGQNPARQCALKGGLSVETPCLTVNKVCGSGLKAIDVACKDIISGKGGLYLAGGIESMSNAPYLADNARWGYKLGHGRFLDDIIIDGLWCPFNDLHMGEIAEELAADYKISRQAQDEFSYESQKKADSAIKCGKYKDEIIPVEIKDRRGNVTGVFDTDEHPREDTTIEKLSALKPVFKKDGTITAGNSSGINDGAALLLVASESKAREFNLKPTAEIIAISEVGVPPKLFGIAPVKAIEKALKDANLELKDIDIFEINEAFAAQSLCVLKDLKLDKDIVNVNGGAIALGHPIGASGSRIVVTLLSEMKKRQSKYGIASICIGSGEGMALILRRLD